VDECHLPLVHSGTSTWLFSVRAQSEEAKMRKLGLARCPCCQSTDVHGSRVQGLRDMAARLLLLRPVRCHRCMFRHYRPFFAHTVPQSAVVAKIPSQRVGSIKPSEQRKA
jgi:hypothetical protein